MMDLSYFLEMVDVKHRYGSNLRKYHAEWKSRPTNENFFYWLDRGDAKELDLPNCSRKRLDDMQVRYLNRESRMLYEVVVDQDGKLVWRKDGIKVDTSDKWRDSVNGIVKIDDPAPLWANRPAFLRGSSESSSVDSEIESPAATSPNTEDKGVVNTPAEQPPGQEVGTEKSSGIPVLQGILKRPTVEKQPKHVKARGKRQNWIFVSSSTGFAQYQSLTGLTLLFQVADTKNNLYIGIKQSGAFQHSSFMHGSRISAAGLIQVRDGQLRSMFALKCSHDARSFTSAFSTIISFRASGLTCPSSVLQPRSGHYRTSSHNLHIFIKSLQSRGVDMSITAVGGSYAAMVGIEGYMKTKGRWKGLKEGMKGMIVK